MHWETTKFAGLAFSPHSLYCPVLELSLSTSEMCRGRERRLCPKQQLLCWDSDGGSLLAWGSAEMGWGEALEKECRVYALGGWLQREAKTETWSREAMWNVGERAAEKENGCCKRQTAGWSHILESERNSGLWCTCGGGSLAGHSTLTGGAYSIHR